MRCNAVFSGGGVRGIGHVGAMRIFEEYGYRFYKVAGSSAGAIVAALISAGYSGLELYEIMLDIDYEKFRQEKLINKFGIVGNLINLVIKYGIFSTDYFEKWIRTLLNKKGIYTFADLKIDDNDYKLRVTACDVTKQRLLILPDDAQCFGIEPDKMDVAYAVKMSMSIPLFYKPVILKDSRRKKHYISDGSLLSNYPMFLFDKHNENSDIPTFGFKFYNPEEMCIKQKNTVNNLIDYCKFTLETMFSAQDNSHISVSNGDFERTVFIPVDLKTRILSATDFDITKDEMEEMYKKGIIAGKKYLDNLKISYFS